MYRVILVLCFFNITYNQLTAQINIEKDSFSLYKTKGALFVQKNNIDSAQYYYDKVIKMALNEENWEEVVSAYFKINDVAIRHYKFITLKKNLNTLDSIFKTKSYLSSTIIDTLYIKNYYNYQNGYYNYKKDNYKEALKHFTYIINRTEQKPDSVLANSNKQEICSAYSFIASIYTKENKYNIANETLDKCIRFIISRHNNKDVLFSIYNLKAYNLQQQNAFSASNNYFLKTLSYHEQIESKNSIATTTYHIFENYINLKQLDSAQYYLTKLEKTLKPEDRYYNLSLLAKAKLYKVNNDYNSALNMLEENLLFAQEKSTKTKLEISKAQLKIAELQQHFDNHNLAIEQLEIALNTLDENIKTTITDIHKFKILKNKIHALKALKNYQELLITSHQAIAVLNDLKPSLKTEEDKLFLQENAFPIFENAIAATYELYNQTKDASYLEQAFYFFEKSKAALMLEALLSSKARTFANIPEALLEKDKQLKLQINDLEKKLLNNVDSESENKLYNLKIEQNNLITTLEKDYNNYYNLKYNSEVLSLKVLEHKIKTKTYISFFYGDKNIYSLGITKNAINFNRITNTENLKSSILTYRDLLKNPNTSNNTLRNLSSKLYKTILSPSLENLTKKSIVIIPDGLLNFIPFETLITPKGKYLIEDTAIGYTISATLLNQLQAKTLDSSNILAFAPSFSSSNLNTTTTLLPLAHSKKEVSNILKVFNGKAFIEKDATLNNFLSNISNHSIIHFATHAILNDDHPDYSYLAFSNIETDKENLLYASDIYNTTLNTNMVTLSACETGAGTLKRGEGTISLTRSFFYSGAASITSSLWKVNDAASADIMNYFYTNLANGQTKDKALQHAKIKYLKLNKDTKLAHPYYWSGFIASGNMQPLITTSNTLFWVASILILFTIIVFFIFLKRKKRN